MDQKKTLKMDSGKSQIIHNNSNEITAAYITDTAGIWHSHTEYELVLNIECNGTRIIGDSVELFDKYDMVLIASGMPHSWHYYTGEKGLPEKHGMVLHFTRSSIGDVLLMQPELKCVNKLLDDSERGIVFSVNDAFLAEKYLDQMINHKSIDKIIDLFCILRILCKAKNKVFLCSDEYRKKYDERGNKKMADIYSYIRENYFRPVTLHEISDIFGMNSFSFSRFFKTNSGTCFIEYLNRIRTNRACYLLRETEYPVHDIAAECGFSSISNFNKQFRKTEGKSPSNYRAQFKTS